MRSLLLLVTLAGTGGCLNAADNDQIQWYDDFEACDGLCGWTTAGDVRRVTTYHPGEHAMSIAPNAHAHHPLAIIRRSDDSGPYNDSDGNWIELTTDCIGPGSLEVRRLGDDGGRRSYAIELALDDRGIGPYRRHWLNLPPLDDSDDLAFTALELTVGSRTCIVDNLQARISGGLIAY